MIVPSSIQQQYDEWKAFIADVQSRVENTLLPFCRKHGFIFEGRMKSLESLAEKIESGRYSSWESIEDLYACTIAVPLSEDEGIVQDNLKRKFDIQTIKRRGNTQKPPDVFRFDSTRITAKLNRPPLPQLGNEASIFKVTFEIQIKSLFEFAWAKTTHALTYKSELIDWKRYRLSAHLKAIVEQADFLLVGFERAAQLVPEGHSPDIDDKSKLREMFQDLSKNGRIPTESVPKDWSRFIDNLYTALQVLNGQKPSGRSYRPLRSLESACTILKNYFINTHEQLIPRSLSLFQIVVGVLCSSGKFTGHWDEYYFLGGETFATVFSTAKMPGSEFSAKPRDLDT